MELILPKKKITAAIFTFMLISFSLANIFCEWENIKSDIDIESNTSGLIASADTAVNNNMLGKYKFIEAYGFVQKVLGKNEISNFEVVKDKQGKLHYTYFAENIKDVSDCVEEMVKLDKKISNTDTRLLYLCPPDKYIKGYTQFSKGLPDSMKNETADYFLKQLNFYGIDTIDFRDYIENSKIKPETLFYNTDHHWKIETAFWAAGEFFNQLEKMYNLNITEEELYNNPDNYNYILYKDSFLGSMGRKTGKYYVGADDFTLIFPKFTTDIEYDVPSVYGDFKLTGRFEDALLAAPVLRDEKSPYDTDKYMIYLNGNFDYAHIKNNKDKNGLKICFIKDSFAVPFAAFASLRCSDVYMLDPRYYNGDMSKLINDLNCDFVCVMFSPENIDKAFFEFGLD